MRICFSFASHGIHRYYYLKNIFEKSAASKLGFLFPSKFTFDLRITFNWIKENCNFQQTEKHELSKWNRVFFHLSKEKRIREWSKGDFFKGVNNIVVRLFTFGCVFSWHFSTIEWKKKKSQQNQHSHSRPHFIHCALRWRRMRRKNWNRFAIWFSQVVGILTSNVPGDCIENVKQSTSFYAVLRWFWDYNGSEKKTTTTKVLSIV